MNTYICDRVWYYVGILLESYLISHIPCLKHDIFCKKIRYILALSLTTCIPKHIDYDTHKQNVTKYTMVTNTETAIPKHTRHTHNIHAKEKITG